MGYVQLFWWKKHKSSVNGFAILQLKAPNKTSQIHTRTHTLKTEAAMQGGALLVTSNLGFSFFLKDTLTCSWQSQQPFDHTMTRSTFWATATPCNVLLYTDSKNVNLLLWNGNDHKYICYILELSRPAICSIRSISPSLSDSMTLH